MKLDHITIRTRNLGAMRDFFLQVFDMEERARPEAIQRIPGHWLYSEDKPIVHLIGSQGYGIDGSAEAFDHVGLRLEGYAAFRARLDRLGISYSKMDLPELMERRLFFRTPCGPLLEAVFTEPLIESDETDR